MNIGLLTVAMGALTRCVLVCSGLALTTGVKAQGLRDPTLAPATVGMQEPGAAPQASLLRSGNMAVVVREGVRYLVVDTRLYTTGQKIGQARIERITETEVWLRESDGVHKVPVFNDIDRRPAQVAASVPARPATLRSAIVKP